jgi:HK97 family phage portal protein
MGNSRDAWIRLATAYSCVSLLSQTIAAMPKRIVRREDKQRTSVRDQQYRHLWGRPNPEMQQIILWQAAAASILTAGNSYLWLDNPAPATRNWWPMHPSRVKPRLNAAGAKEFVVDGRHVYGPDRILHIPSLSLDGVRGISPVEEAGAHSLELALVAEDYARRGLKANEVPPGVIKTDQDIDQDQAADLKARWRESRSGAIGEVAVFGKGADFKPITFTPEQLQFIALREHQREDILQWWRVPAHLLGLVDKPSTWGTGIEQLGIGFVTYTLLPWIVAFEQAVSDALLPPELEFKFVVNALLRGDMKSRFDSYAQGRQWGWLSADTILELEDMPPRGVEDDYLTPLNMQRISVLGAPLSNPTSGPEIDRTAAIIEAALVSGRASHRELAGVLPAPLLREGRCPECTKLLGKNVNVGAELHCDRCRAIVTLVDMSAI